MNALPQRYAWYIGAALLLVAAFAFACHARDEHLIAVGRNEGRTEVLREKLARDSTADRLAAAVVQHDTIVLTKWVTRYDTVRRTLKLTDTIAVKQFVYVADSTIRACRETVGSLTTLCQRKDTIIQDLRAQLAIRMTAPPKASLSQRILWGLGGLAVGYVGGRLSP
jgi:hypothetical protein